MVWLLWINSIKLLYKVSSMV